MSDLMIFKNNDFGEIRTVLINGEAYFVGKDVAEILGYNNTRDALSKKVDSDDKKDGVAICDAMGRDQYPTLINESGLYNFQANYLQLKSSNDGLPARYYLRFVKQAHTV